jgi:hypothetical protein
MGVLHSANDFAGSSVEPDGEEHNFGSCLISPLVSIAEGNFAEIGERRLDEDFYERR